MGNSTAHTTLGLTRPDLCAVCSLSMHQVHKDQSPPRIPPPLSPYGPVSPIARHSFSPSPTRPRSLPGLRRAACQGHKAGQRLPRFTPFSPSSGSSLPPLLRPTHRRIALALSRASPSAPVLMLVHMAAMAKLGKSSQLVSSFLLSPTYQVRLHRLAPRHQNRHSLGRLTAGARLSTAGTADVRRCPTPPHHLTPPRLQALPPDLASASVVVCPEPRRPSSPAAA